MKLRIISFISVLFILGFMFISVINLHPVGEPLSSSRVLEDRGNERTDIRNIYSMDDYFIRNGQRETGSNNIVTSVVFDYRAFDTLGEATVLFIAVSSISMLLFHFLKKKKQYISAKEGFGTDVSRIVSYAAFFLFPIILVFGAYLVIHGHISPGGGFQGGAVMASGTALILMTAFITRNSKMTRKLLSVFESTGLFIFILMGLLGLGTAFLYNFMATPDGFLNSMPFGPNTGDISSAGTLPILSLAVGLEVFCGISIILVSLFNLTKEDKSDKEMDTAEETE
jgi:multisubunit Na+/H+ antiporter MnhB subunit